MTVTADIPRARFSAAFPALGDPLPDARLSDQQLEAYRREHGLPHWLYHVGILRASQGTPLHALSPATLPWLEPLSAYLEIPRHRYKVVALELIHGSAQVADCPKIAFPLRLDFKGRSHALAVAAGLKAAAAD